MPCANPNLARTNSAVPILISPEQTVHRLALCWNIDYVVSAADRTYGRCARRWRFNCYNRCQSLSGSSSRHFSACVRKYNHHLWEFGQTKHHHPHTNIDRPMLRGCSSYSLSVGCVCVCVCVCAVFVFVDGSCAPQVLVNVAITAPNVFDNEISSTLRDLLVSKRATCSVWVRWSIALRYLLKVWFY